MQQWNTFLDLKSAFYRVLRSRLLGVQLSDQVICGILCQMGVGVELFGDILAWSQGSSLLQQLDGHSQRVIRSFMAFSAFMLPGDGSFHCSRSGTRPGDTLADVLFAVVLADCLESVRSELDMQGLCNTQIPEHHTHQIPVWADDVCVPFGAKAPSELLSMASRVCEIVHIECCRRALQPNYKRRKTELLLSFAGQGAVKTRRQLMARGGCVDFEAFGKPVHVGRAQTYQHLGATVGESVSPGADLRRKVGKALGYVRPLGRSVLRKPCLEPRTRSAILRGLGLSVSSFNVEVWCHLSNEEMHGWVLGSRS